MKKKMMCRIVSMILVVAMMFCILPDTVLEVNAASSYTINVNMNLLNQVGVQPDWTSSCSCYALAYCRTLLDQKAHYFYEYNNYGNNQYSVWCSWYKGNYVSKNASSNAALLKEVYNYINQNKPVILYVSNSSYSHYIMIVGYKNVTNVNNLSLDNFLMIDSLGVSSRNKTLAIQSPSARGYWINSSRQYVVPNSGSVPASYSVTTNAASNVTNYSAAISGSLSSGTASYWGFDIGTNQNQLTSYNYTGSSCNVQKFTGELQAGTTYYYRMWAVVGGNKVVGGIKSFTTTKVQPGISEPIIAVKDVARGDSIGVSWSAASNAQYYWAYLYDENDNLLQTTKVTGTSVAFQGLETAGTYYVAIEAFNNAGTGGRSSLQSVTVHPDVTVSFVDYDGTKLCEDQIIGYGKSATAPAAPSRTGYTFKKWDGNYTNVTESVEVKATYDINSYTVRFFDNKGKEIGAPQKVNYGSAAIAPEYQPEDGYALFGWDRDFSKITEDTDVTANIDWYNENFSVFTKIDSATRVADSDKTENEGYEVNVKVINNNTSTTRGRVVVALETKEGKLVTTTESSAFSVQAGATKEVNVFVPYDGYAKTVKVFTVSQYSNVVPIADLVSTDIDQSQPWSDWSASTPPADAYQIESRTEYRYKTKSTMTSYETSISGWIQTGSQWVRSGGGNIDYVTNWPSGFDRNNTIYKNYNKSPVTAYENATEKRTVSTSTIGYVYWHWCRNDHVGAGTVNRAIEYYYTSQFKAFHAFVQSTALGYNKSADAFAKTNTSVCDSTYWWNSANPGQLPLYRCTYVDYNKQFIYEKWSDFSEWSPTVKQADANTIVEIRTAYRYRTNEMLEEDNSGTVRTISGNIGVENANKKASLFVYKVDSASDYTNEYVGQGKIDAEGNYSFTFKLREEPTAETGDFTVVLGIEGASSEIYLNPIEAPKKTYTVKFYDKDGNVISEQSIQEGRDAVLPDTENMQIEGYRFLNWTESNRNIREDLDIYPNYELQEYTVVFVDWTAKKVSMEKFKYGDVLITPELGEVGENQTIIWDVAENTVVKEDMIVTSKIEDKMVEVEIIGPDGELQKKEEVKCGDGVALPDMEEDPDYIFIGWKVKDNLEEEVTMAANAVVTRNTTFYAQCVLARTTDFPYSNVENGEYSEVQTITLSCDTAGADIYYTIDGSDPSDSKTAIKYTSPFELTKSCQLRYIAKCNRMNDSAEINQFFAINTGNVKYHLLEILEQTVFNNGQYIALVKDGYKISSSDFANLSEGHTFEGFFKDEEMTQEFRADIDTVNESMTLYVKYSPIIYTVTFKNEDGNVVKTELVPYGQEAAPPVMEKEGYVFAGWDTDDYLCVKGDVTAQAKFTLESEYARVKLNRSKLSITERYSYQLEATIYPDNLSDKEVIWSSEDYNIANVENGVVTGVAPGTTTITVKVVETGETASCEIIVLADTEFNISESLIGDMNKNGSLDPLDALAILDIIAVGSTNLDEATRKLADVNGDGFVTPLDALAVLDMVAAGASN